MPSRLTQDYILSCKPLNCYETISAYVQLASVLSDLEFFREFLDLADSGTQGISFYAITGMNDLIGRQLERLYQVSAILCKNFEKIDMKEFQQ